MREYLKIAWRNIWRNRRRTLITTASVFFAIFFAVTMRGFHLGMWTSLLENVLHSYSGYLQVHAVGYWREKTLDYALVQKDNLENRILKSPNVRGIIPRLESFALASVGDKTKGVLVSGVDPLIENKYTKLEEKLKKGRFLIQGDDGVVLSERLAKFLKIKIGDTLTLLSQGYQGVTAAGVFPVRGIVKLPAPEWDNQMVYMDLSHAQKFYSANGLLTSMVIDIHKTSKLDQTAWQLIRSLNSKEYETMTWKEMLVELYQQWQLDNASMIIILALLYMIIGFGIFGTVMMMTTERVREFGIMIALGMRREKLTAILIAEMFYIILIGVLAGMIFSIPVVYYFRENPITFGGTYAKTFETYGMEPVISMAWQYQYVINQGLAVVIITVLAIIYPIYSVARLRLTKALK